MDALEMIVKHANLVFCRPAKSGEVLQPLTRLQGLVPSLLSHRTGAQRIEPESEAMSASSYSIQSNTHGIPPSHAPLCPDALLDIMPSPIDTYTLFDEFEQYVIDPDTWTMVETEGIL